MQKYNLLHPLFLSFYSKSLYRDVAKNWRGMVFLYLLLLLAVSWIPTAVEAHWRFDHYAEKNLLPLVEQIPMITVKDGEVSTVVETPYFVLDPETKREIAVIDLTGEYTSPEDIDAQILLTRNRLFMKYTNRPETRMYDLSGIKEFTLTQEIIRDWIELDRDWLAIVLYFFVLLFSYAYRTLQALLYGAIGLLFAKLARTRLSYSSSVRLAIIAVTPVIVIDSVREVLNMLFISTPWWIGAFVIAMVYLFFGVKANSKTETPQTPIPEGPLNP